MTAVELARPWVLLAVPVVAGLAWHWTGKMDLLPAGRATLRALRVLAGLAMTLALAEPRWADPPDAGPVLVIGVDVSDSHRVAVGDPPALLADALAEWSATAEPSRLRTALVAFAAEPRVVRPLRPGLPTTADWESLRRPPSPAATDISAALRVMAELLPDRADAAGARLLLITDGRQTLPMSQPTPEPTSERLGPSLGYSAAAPVFVWAGGQLPLTDARVVALRLPVRASPGQPLRGTVTLSANRPVRLRVRISRSRGSRTRPVAELAAELRPGEPTVLGFADLALADLALGEAPDAGEREGVWTYRAELRSADGTPASSGPWRDDQPINDALSAAVEIGRPGAILLVSRAGAGETGPESPARAALRTVPGYRVETAAPDDPRLADPAELRRFATVLLDDVPSEAVAPPLADKVPVRERLPAPAVRAIGDYLRNAGGGLIVLGGAHSFGPGGYHLSELNRLLPVDADPRSRRPTAMVLLMDRSGSMARSAGGGAAGAGAPSQLDVARQAVRLLAPPVLSPRDELAVLGFAESATVLRPLAAGAGAAELSGLLDGVAPTGGTAIVPALRAALAQLAAARAESRRIVLVTDGESPDLADPATAEARDRLRAELAERRVRLSVILAGGEGSATLRSWAEATGGRYFEAADFRLVPERLLEDLMSAGDFVRAGPVPIRRGSAGSDGADADRIFAPLLGGAQPIPPTARLVRTVARPDAAVVLASDADEPLVAVGSVGLGRSAAVPTSLEPEWAGGWAGPGAGLLLATLLRWSARPTSDPDWSLSAEPVGSGVRLILRGPTAADVTGPLPRVRLSGPGDAEAVAELWPSSPGRWVGQAELPSAGSWWAVLDYAGRPPLRVRADLGHPTEYAEPGFAAEPLTELSRATGGELVYRLSDWAEWERTARCRGSEPDRALLSGLLGVLIAAASAELLLRIAWRKGWL